MEGAHEVGQVAEPDIERHLGDRLRVAGQQAGGPAQTGTDQILVRSDAEDAREKPQEVKRAEPELPGRALEIDGLVRVRVDPECGFDRAAAVACPGFRGSLLPSGEDFDEARREQHTEFVEANFAPTLGGRLSQTVPQVEAVSA